MGKHLLRACVPVVVVILKFPSILGEDLIIDRHSSVVIDGTWLNVKSILDCSIDLFLIYLFFGSYCSYSYINVHIQIQRWMLITTCLAGRHG